MGFLGLSLTSDLKQAHRELASARAENEKIKRGLAEKEAAIREREEAFQRIYKEKTKGFPWLAEACREYGRLKKLMSYDDELLGLGHLELRKRREHETYARWMERARNAIAEAKVSKHIVSYYESIFPWIVDYRDAEDEQIVRHISLRDGESSRDPERQWVPDAEWERMPSADRSQLALDRWCASRGSSWEAGIKYERFVGFEYEKEGYFVSYRGAKMGKKDEGIDLICEMPKQRTVLVQCKRWKEFKVIREKHLFQLAGTAAVYKAENSLKNSSMEVVPIFATTTVLTERAREVAKILGITIQENKACPKEWPHIKCTVRGEEMFYHLPFDERYDKIRMRLDEGDRFAWTCHDAEREGFVRAKRWSGV